MKELKTLTLNGTTYDSFPDQSAVKSISGIRPDIDGDIDLSGSGYDLKDGYGYTEDIYIAEDGTETAISGMYYKCLDYIPVKGGISYTMYGCGYALYDGEKNFISAICDTTGWNQILEFTPSEAGFVRLTMNCDDISYARFCKTVEKYLEPYDYEPHPSPFFDPKIPCDVHLYGDSNSDWSWMVVPSNAWSYRFKELIESMNNPIYNHRFGAFANKESVKDPENKANYISYILEDSGYIRFSAYTNFFGVATKDVGRIDVRIDGQPYDPIVASGNITITFDDYGKHTIELFGVSGTNSVSSIGTRKQRSFTNHASFGSGASDQYLTIPDGNIAMVMYAANDRDIRPAYYYEVISDFVRQCKARGITVYLFAPAPVNVGGETAGDYLQTMNDVIAQLPSDCISVYGELELAEMLCGQSLFYDDFHLNELGHKILYVVVATKLQLAPPLSEVLHDIGNIPALNDALLFTPQELTTEQKAQARANIGVSEKLEIEVVLKESGAELIDASVITVFDSLTSGNTVVLYRNTESGDRIYYRLDQRNYGTDGSETLTFTHKSTSLTQYVYLILGGPLDGGSGSIGVGTEVATAQDVGAVPIPVTAEIGQAMCVSEVDENGSPTAWKATDLSSGDSDWQLLETISLDEDVSAISYDFEKAVNELYIIFKVRASNADGTASGGYANASLSTGGLCIQNQQMFYKSSNLSCCHVFKRPNMLCAEWRLYANDTRGHNAAQRISGSITNAELSGFSVSLVDSTLFFKAGGVVEVWYR